MRVCTRRVIYLFLCSVVAGCASREELAKRISGRWGPDPVISAEAANSVIDRQNLVLDYISNRSHIRPLKVVDDPSWYYIAQWGFNIGREDCAAYLDNLFRINREKLRNHDVITATQTATIGIVTAATPHAATALSVLGQVFGLAANLNDAILQSYLFTEAPGLISIKVKQLQDNYQNSFKPNGIRSAAEAYNALQNYYNICLPQSIEGVILDKVANSEATSGDKGTSSGAGSAKPQKTVAAKGTSTTTAKTPLLK